MKGTETSSVCYIKALYLHIKSSLVFLLTNRQSYGIVHTSWRVFLIDNSYIWTFLLQLAIIFPNVFSIPTIYRNIIFLSKCNGSIWCCAQSVFTFIHTLLCVSDKHLCTYLSLWWVLVSFIQPYDQLLASTLMTFINCVGNDYLLKLCNDNFLKARGVEASERLWLCISISRRLSMYHLMKI